MRYAGAVTVVVIIVEVVAAVAVAHTISWPLTLLLLAGLSLVGVELLRREGWAVFRGRRQEQTPQQALGNAAAGLLGAALVAVPGFVTGVVGLASLTAPGRALLRRLLAHRVGSQLLAAGNGWRRRPGQERDPRVVDSTLDEDPARPVDLTKPDRL